MASLPMRNTKALNKVAKRQVPERTGKGQNILKRGNELRKRGTIPLDLSPRMKLSWSLKRQL